MKRDIRISTKMKILNCYVFSALDHGCESWTWNRPMCLKVNASEKWCYGMIPGISWSDRVSTPEVIKRVQIELQTESHFTKDMIAMKMGYAGYVLRAQVVYYIYRHQRAEWRKKRK